MDMIVKIRTDCTAKIIVFPIFPQDPCPFELQFDFRCFGTPRTSTRKQQKFQDLIFERVLGLPHRPLIHNKAQKGHPRPIAAVLSTFLSTCPQRNPVRLDFSHRAIREKRRTTLYNDRCSASEGANVLPRPHSDPAERGTARRGHTLGADQIGRASCRERV